MIYLCSFYILLCDETVQDIDILGIYNHKGSPWVNRQVIHISTNLSLSISDFKTYLVNLEEQPFQKQLWGEQILSFNAKSEERYVECQRNVWGSCQEPWASLTDVRTLSGDTLTDTR